MDRDKIVETMAKAMAENDALDFDKILHPMQSMYRSHARAALSALEAVGLVVVPRQENSDIINAGLLADIFDGPHHIRMEMIYRAMISAALGEKGEGDEQR